MTTPAQAPYAGLVAWPDPMPPAIPVTVAAVAGQQIFTGRCIVTGWSIRNAGGAVDNTQIIDGGSGAGQVIGSVHLNAGNNETGKAGNTGVLCLNGVYVTESAGTTSGAVYIVPF